MHVGGCMYTPAPPSRSSKPMDVLDSEGRRAKSSLSLSLSLSRTGPSSWTSFMADKLCSCSCDEVYRSVKKERNVKCV